VNGPAEKKINTDKRSQKKKSVCFLSRIYF